ncbi:hypothetical protein QUB63_01165 [Microcoleus sp. ARI1-B5]|uniref:hypothetical protein n=1 Tax=unclassified Microcoleus TaxID=2642155 RepID=UPI002FD033F8
MDKIVSGKRGWVTRGLSEYAGWGDRSFFAGAIAQGESYQLARAIAIGVNLVYGLSFLRLWKL